MAAAECPHFIKCLRPGLRPGRSCRAVSCAVAGLRFRHRHILSAHLHCYARAEAVAEKLVRR